VHYEKHHTAIFIVILTVLAIVVFLGVGGFTLWFYLRGNGENPEPEKIDITSEGWGTYENSRFGFSVKYPASFEKQESDNGDGATFSSTSPRITLSVFASLNGENQTLSSYLDSIATDLKTENSQFSETSKKDIQIKDYTAQERVWKYEDAIEGVDMIQEQTTVLKDNNFYTIQMVIYYNDYEAYKKIYEDTVKTFNFN
jgi:hypothetical protein